MPAEAESDAADARTFEKRVCRIVATELSAVAGSTIIIPQARERLIAIASHFNGPVTRLRFNPEIAASLQQYTERSGTDLTTAEFTPALRWQSSFTMPRASPSDYAC